MGLQNLFQLATSAIDITEAQEIVNEGFTDALSTMKNMCANEGQNTIYDNYVVPEFKAAKGPIKEGWNDVDIGEYMDFMGDIVNEGNSIMQEAYEYAQEILSEMEEAAEEAAQEAES